jgi:hypothetical protein
MRRQEPVDLRVHRTNTPRRWLFLRAQERMADWALSCRRPWEYNAALMRGCPEGCQSRSLLKQS